jgi:transposase
MSKKELKRVKVLALASEMSISRTEAARRLGIDKRQVYRLLRRFETEGAAGICHRGRGRTSGRGMAAADRARIEQRLTGKFLGFGPTFASEKLLELDGIQVSSETVRRIQIRLELHKPKKRKVPGYHPRRPRRSKEGALLQVDGSHHAWFGDENDRSCLVALVDDATSRIVGARFYSTETTRAYMELMKEYIKLHGCPMAIYSDKHSIFRQTNEAVRDQGKLTNLGKALSELDIELICANSPQAKGRVERCFGTLQDRWVKELQLAGVMNIETANQKIGELIAGHNARFAVPPAHSDRACFPVETSLDLERVFSIRSKRQISKGMSFSYEGTLYQIDSPRSPNRMVGTQLEILERLDGKTDYVWNGTSVDVTPFKELSAPQRTLNGKELAALAQDRKPYKPAKHHPWNSRI